jgi:hypothetical protein
MILAPILRRVCACGDPFETQCKWKTRCDRCQIRHQEEQRKRRRLCEKENRFRRGSPQPNMPINQPRDLAR